MFKALIILLVLLLGVVGLLALFLAWIDHEADEILLLMEQEDRLKSSCCKNRKEPNNGS